MVLKDFCLKQNQNLKIFNERKNFENFLIF